MEFQSSSGVPCGVPDLALTVAHWLGSVSILVAGEAGVPEIFIKLIQLIQLILKINKGNLIPRNI